MWEIDVLDLLADILQHHAAVERHRAQVRREQGKLVWRQRRQETVELAVELPGNRGDAIRHRSLLLTGEARQSGYMN